MGLEVSRATSRWQLRLVTPESSPADTGLASSRPSEVLSAIMQLSPMRRRSRRIWHRYAEPNGGLRQAPFGRPQAVLAYLSRYTHRVAIANAGLIALRPHPASPSMEALSRRWSRPPESHDARHRRVHRRFSSMSCHTASTASATTGC